MWPSEVTSIYDPVRPLGKGGFGDVWLGRPTESADKAYDICVAIKKVDTSTPVGKAYADREVQILKLLDHHHIVKLIHTFDVKEAGCSYVALSYAEGPTLEKILEFGGAVGIPFAHVLAQQLVSTIAYLHDHAVIHRDIKPDNVIVKGSSLNDDDIWDDGEEGKKGAQENKWQITLIDFGFARALQAEDVEGDIALQKTVNAGDLEDLTKSFFSSDLDEDEKNVINEALGEDDESTHSGRGRGRSLDKSVSHARVRDLSALGNRAYAAPEIISGVHEKRASQSKSDKKRAQKESLADFVSNYGMDVDAYSLGSTLRYAITGVPPGNNVDEYIAMKNNIIFKVMKSLTACFSKKEESEQLKRTKKYRTGAQCPKEAILLIRGLTDFNPKSRTTVRAARYYPWIIEGKNLTDDEVEEMKRKPVEFLKIDVLDPE